MPTCLRYVVVFFRNNASLAASVCGKKGRTTPNDPDAMGNDDDG